MESRPKTPQKQNSLFQVYLRLRPQISQQQQKSERYLTVEPEPPTAEDGESRNPSAGPKHITLHPPADSRKRAVEKFAFTKVFEENASQLELFRETGMSSIIDGVLNEGRDGLVATLGVTGSGKSHTTLGTKSQRGVTQMALDVLFKSLSSTIRSADPSSDPFLLSTLTASDTSEAQLFSAQSFIESIYGDPYSERGRASRAQTPVAPSRAQTPMVWNPFKSTSSLNPKPMHLSSVGLYPRNNALENGNPTLGDESIVVSEIDTVISENLGNASESHLDAHGKHILPSQLPFWNTQRITKHIAKSRFGMIKEPYPVPNISRRPMPPRPSALPQVPDVSDLAIDIDTRTEHVVLVSMYEVYNDRIFDLLSPAPSNGGTTTRQNANNQKDRRRPLLFKPTEASPDRKVVAGLRKVVCGSYEEAMIVLETGLHERRVAGTGSNTASSRSHGFFCMEVKKKYRSRRGGEELWLGNTLTVVDLAGSERARNAKTTGSTLAEAGKINESLMYLGQCLQMQGEYQEGNKPTLVPFRQCKLTELLFSNSFPTANQIAASSNRNPQKGVMIITADPLGDFNATSQILRYSALAREVTVPRIPSVTSTILSGSTNVSKNPSSNGRVTPYSASAEELETAALEIARISDEYDNLSVRLAEEEILRAEAEMKWNSAEEKCMLIEQEVREECWEEMDERMEEERRRWQLAWDEQAGRHDDHLDKKLELLSRGVNIHEDPEPTSEEKIEELERENEMLRSKLALMEQDALTQSPTRQPRTKNVFQEKDTSLGRNFSSGESDIENSLSNLNVNESSTKPTIAPMAPTPKAASKKPRKLTTRKRDLAPEDEL